MPAPGPLSTPNSATTPDHGVNREVALLQRLEWRVLKRLDGRIQGDYRTLLYGSGIDVADLREYQAGDDVRHIDWNVTARMDTPYVRTYLEDRELTAWLLLDRSPSMGFGPTERPKELVLTELSLSLARLLSRGGNLVGAMLFNNTVEQTLQPRTGRNHVLHLSRELLKPAANTGTSTNLSTLLQGAQRTLRRRSLIILISDFVSEPGWEKPLLTLSQRHEVIAIQLRDPRETDLPDAGLIVVQDAETGELLSVDTSDAEFRQRFRVAAEQQQNAIVAAATRAGVDLHTVSTEDDLVQSLVRIAASRKHRRGK
jgi:uncharacterized protein (DUF58 family)